jgi:Spy/CpxP family protein refolding chaperone
MGPPQGQPSQPDPLAENFFPPELLMQNQKKIGLTEEQSKFIREEIGKTQAKFTDLQWQLQGEQETLTSLVKQDRPDEKQVLSVLDKLLNLENEIKRTHLTLALRIKNKLTTEQQEQLRELRQRPRAPMPGGPVGPKPPGGQPQPR